MILKFKRVHAHNFSCYRDAELILTDMGYTVVSGRNNNDSDNAVSNGSGKSSIFNAISYAITGETTQGLSNNIENIYTDPNDCWVELEFSVDEDEFLIKRFKTPRSDLKVFVNGEDKSGKGIKESQKILDGYLPDVTSQLIGSIIILGQGLPYRFTYNAPSQRKFLLEKLTKSDYMVQTVKDKLESRKEELKLQLRHYEDSDIANRTKLKLNLERLDKIKLDIFEYEDCSSEGTIEDRLIDIKSSLDSYDNELLEIKNDKQVIEDNINKLMQEKTELAKNDSDTLTLLLEDVNTNLQLVDRDIIENNTKIKSLKSEIKKLDAVVDVCPTCGQKIIGVHKIDTTNLKSDLKSLELVLSKLYENQSNLNSQKNFKIESHKTEYNNKYKLFDSKIKSLKEKLVELDNKIKTIDSLYQSLIKEEARLSNIQDNYIKLKDELVLVEQTVEDLREAKNIIDANITDVNEHLNVVQSLITLAKREFRSVLLDNIVKYMDKRAKQYSLEVFGAELITIATDENYINVIFNNKYYEALSGGEKQKIDIIIQLVLRDLLSSQLNIKSNILVMDEVLDFLDEKGADAILKLVQDYTTDIESIFMISHRVEKLNISYDNILEVIKDNDNVSTIYVR